MNKQKLIIPTSIIIGCIILGFFYYTGKSSFTKSPERYKCAGVLEDKRFPALEPENIDVYFKFTKYIKDSDAYLTIEIPGKINRLLYLHINQVDDIIFFYRSEKELLSGGQFSRLSKTLIFVDEIWGNFSGNCEKID